METLNVITTNSQVDALVLYLQDKEYVSFDTETTGITSDAEIIGYSVCAEPDVAFYVITARWCPEEKKLFYLETKDSAATVMECLKSKKLIMHNGLFDCARVQENYKVNLVEALHTDTMVLAHLLDENRRVGLKELGVAKYGADAKKEQDEMKASVLANGGELTKKNYELFKGDPDLIGKYACKDAILTYNLFYEMVPELYEEGLDKFFYTDESMPLLKGPTWELNTVGLKVDVERLKDLQKSLEVEIMEAKAFVYEEIAAHIKDKYPGTNKSNTFNLGSGSQLAWLLFDKMGESFIKVSDAGKELCYALELRVPYTNEERRTFINVVRASKGNVWREAGKVFDKKTRKFKAVAKVADYWTYLSTDRTSLARLAKKYKWVQKLLELKKNDKLLQTYVMGIQGKVRYGIIHPSFLQTGTSSGRYSSRTPNFQNLPRDDKRIKACIVSRPGKVFVGADYSQLEPRVFASYSQDRRLMECFRLGQDFYSVTGVEVFNKQGCSLYKSDADFFGTLHEDLRYKSKGVTLSATYGTTAPKLATALGCTREEAQKILRDYFNKFPQVETMMLEAHELVKTQGYVESLYGRKRRLPDAMNIRKRFGDASHAELPYDIRKYLNLAVNHRIQSTSASIVNRSAISLFRNLLQASIPHAKLVLQVHDSLIVECLEKDAESVAILMQDAMENTCELPGVSLLAEPKIGHSLAEV